MASEDLGVASRAKSARPQDGEGFQRVADAVADAVRNQLTTFFESCGASPEAYHAVCLGALAGVVQTWVFANQGASTEARMTEAFAQASADFVAQAYAERRMAAS